jgi:hypothetical protein
VHGGCLRLWPSDEAGRTRSPAVDIEPLHDRFLLFYSDKRCPHEVHLHVCVCVCVCIATHTQYINLYVYICIYIYIYI